MLQYYDLYSLLIVPINKFNKPTVFMNPNLFRLERIQISDPENLLRPVTGSVLIRRFRHVVDIVVRVRFPCRYTYSMKLVDRKVEGEE